MPSKGSIYKLSNRNASSIDRSIGEEEAPRDSSSVPSVFRSSNPFAISNYRYSARKPGEFDYCWFPPDADSVKDRAKDMLSIERGAKDLPIDRKKKRRYK